jgi:hypothetical protein
MVIFREFWVGLGERIAHHLMQCVTKKRITFCVMIMLILYPYLSFAPVSLFLDGTSENNHLSSVSGIVPLKVKLNIPCHA